GDHELPGAHGLAHGLRRRRARLHRRPSRGTAARPGRAHGAEDPPGAVRHLRGLEDAAARGARVDAVRLAAALELRRDEMVALVGGGGETSAMLRLAREMTEAGGVARPHRTYTPLAARIPPAPADPPHRARAHARL